MAVTHRSFSPEVPNNETLEFLGDAVLALAMADLLMRRFPAAREGDLSKLRAGLVNAETLAQKARTLDLGRWLRLGKGEEKSGGRDKESILAGALRGRPRRRLPRRRIRGRAACWSSPTSRPT